MKENIIEILNKNKNIIDKMVSSWIKDEISNKKVRNAKKSHNVDIYEDILLLQDHTIFGSATESTILTENYISLVNYDSKTPEKIYWKNIDRVEYIDKYYYFFFDPDDDENRKCWKHLSFHLTDDTFYQLCANLLSEIASLFENKEQKLFKDLEKTFKEQQYDDFINKTEQYFSDYNNGDYSFELHHLRAKAFLKKNDTDKAFKEISYCIHSIDECKKENGEVDDYNSDLNHIFETKGEIFLALQKNYEAIKEFNFALKNSIDKEDKIRLERSIVKANQSLAKNFLDTKYSKRKVVLVDNVQNDFSSEYFKVLRKDLLPQIKFPIGHPVSKELYVGHPFNNKIYIPISTLEETLFMDRFQEFSYFLQSLGATKISIENNRGKAVEQIDNVSAEINVKGEFGKAGISIANSETNKTRSSNAEQSQNSNKHISREQVFLPIKKPFLPENLVWYPHEPSWQRLYEQRINGNLLVHNEIVSTKQHQTVSRNEKRNLQQSLELYMSNLNVSHSLDKSHMFTEKETTEWVIHVEFAPKNELLNDVIGTKLQSENQLNIPSNEQKYVEEIKFMLEDDGEIDKDERRMLERKRRKYKISEGRALELEKPLMLTNDLTAEESEYVEEIKEYAKDGKISDGERRILMRLINKLGISEERAIFLENFALKTENKKVYTDEEIKYIEEIKFCLEYGGEISASERRMLNKECNRLGISPKRSEEIEQEFIKEVKK
jgi:hypothetical protein